MRKEHVRLLRVAILVVAALAIVALMKSAVFTVSESEQAVVTTFGSYTKTVSAGLHGKLPWPIQQVTILPVNLTQKIELGYGVKSDGSYYSIPEESTMITQDMNLVNIDFFVEWKISDPRLYLFSSEKPNVILKNMLQSTVRSVVGTSAIDDALTTGKIQIQADVKEQLIKRLNEQDIGVAILDVKVNDSEPPTENVAKAFRDVETAKQQKDTALNQAYQYRNSRLPQAEAQADKIRQDAESAKQARIRQATGERDRFLAMYTEYLNFPAITRSRMYLETLEAILPGVRVYLDDGTGVQKLLPLEDLIGGAKPTSAVQPPPAVQPTSGPQPQTTPEAPASNP